MGIEVGGLLFRSTSDVVKSLDGASRRRRQGRYECRI